MPSDQIDRDTAKLCLNNDQAAALSSLLTWTDELRIGDSYEGFNLVSWSRDLPTEAISELRALVDPGEKS